MEIDLTDEDLSGPLPSFKEHTENVSLLQLEEATRMLSLDTSQLPSWFSSQLQSLLGPIPPQDITIVAARPGCGKTSFMLAQARHMVSQGHRVIYIGTEMSGWRLRVQVAAQECQLPVKLVIQNRWGELPPGSKERLLGHLAGFDEASRGLWLFAPEDYVDHVGLADYVRVAGTENATIFVDHLHEVDWGSGRAGLTEAMSTGLRKLKDHAKEHKVRMILAAQLKRTGSYDVLSDYMVPDQSTIKQSGATEEIAHTIILLHRALKADATEGDLALVRRGQKKIVDVVEHGTAVATIGKDRLGGSRDAEARLYVGNGELFDTPEARNTTYGSLEWTLR